MGFFGSNDIAGIDIGAGAIKVARIARGSRPKLLSAALMELPLDAGRPAGVGAELRYLLSGKKIGSKNVVTQIPGKDLTIRSLSLPRIPLSELREAVRWEAKRHISYPLEAALVEYLIVGERREGTVDKYDILMVAVERGMVIEHLAPFNEADISVAAVDANSLALRNVLKLRRLPDDDNILYVDIGAGKTEINIFKSGALRFSRCFESGGNDMTRAVAEALGTRLQDAEALKKNLDILVPSGEDKAAAAVKGRLDVLLAEVRRSVEYYKTTFRETGVRHSILTGGVSLLNGIKDYFTMSLDIPVELDDPFSVLSARKSVLQEFGPLSPRFSAAIGLALRKA